MQNSEQHNSLLVFDQVMDSRGEKTWNDKDLKVLKTASLLKVQHYHRALKKQLIAEQMEARERLKTKNNSEKDLISKFEQKLDSIAGEIMKGTSVEEAFKMFVDNDDEEDTWRSISLESSDFNSD